MTVPPPVTLALCLLAVLLPAPARAAGRDDPALNACLDASIPDPEAAVAACTDYLHDHLVDGGSALALTRRAQVNLQRAARRTALADLDEALRLKPGEAFQAHVLSLRALTLLGLGELARARADIEESLRLLPASNSSLAWRYSADIRRASGDLPGALDDMDAAVLLSPPVDSFRAQLLTHRARLRRAHGDIDAALLDLDEAARLIPRSLDIGEDRCLTHLFAGLAREAKAACEATDRADSPDNLARADRAAFRRLDEDRPGATAVLAHALADAGDTSWANRLRFRLAEMQAGPPP